MTEKKTPRVAVTAMGVLSPLGHTAHDLFEALLEGRSAVGPLTAFEVPGKLHPRAVQLPEDDPERWLQGKNLRPLDRPGRLAAAAARLALGPEDDEEDDELRARIGLVLGTMFGSVHTVSKFDRRALTHGPQYSKPFDFANSVINAAAGQTAIWHRLAGVNATIGGGAAAGAQALAYGADLIRAGRAEILLAGGAEELCFESFHGFAQAGLSCSNGGVAVPLHARRRGFVPGEGAALLQLESDASAKQRQAPILGWLAGSGTSFDPSRGQDPDRAAQAMERAVQAALEDAAADPDRIDALAVSASGSPAVDRAEARGVGAALGDRAATVPVTAVKGALGEGLGASGAFQATVLLEAFRRHTLPGTVGLDEPDSDLPLKQADASPREGTFRLGLVTAGSWDGNACALVLEAP